MGIRGRDVWAFLAGWQMSLLAVALILGHSWVGPIGLALMLSVSVLRWIDCVRTGRSDIARDALR